MNREEFRQRVIGYYYTTKRNEVGASVLKEELIDAVVEGAMFAYDLFNKEITPTVRLPLYQVDSANFKLPEVKL